MIDGHAMDESFADTRSALDRARHLPGAIYNSCEIFALEKDSIFMTDWLCIGRVEQLENAGDYLTLRVMGEPAVVTRDADQALNAFANVCAHRGVEVASGHGNTKEFSCPYHGWLYDLSGRLVGAPYMKEAEGFDPSRCRLTPLNVDVWEGWIFINFDRGAEPLSTFVEDFDNDFGFLKPGDCRVADIIELELDCNWKLFVENLMDFYHVQSVHLDTLAGGTPQEFQFNLRKQGGFSVFYEGIAMTPDGKSLFGNMPSLADRPETFSAIGFLAPNMYMSAYCDIIRSIVVWPVSPDRTRALGYTLIPAVHSGSANFDDKVRVYHDFFVQVMEEDQGTMMSLQQAMATNFFDPGRMSTMEENVHHAINGYVDKLLAKT